MLEHHRRMEVVGPTSHNALSEKFLHACAAQSITLHHAFRLSNKSATTTIGLVRFEDRRKFLVVHTANVPRTPQTCCPS